MSAATTTSGKSKTAGKVSPSRSTPHVTPATQHANGTVMTKSNSKPFVQPKLTVGKPNDSFEQQADAMAQKVVRMTPADIQQLSASKQTIRRQINPSAENNPSRSVLQKKNQPGSFMLQASQEKEKVGKKEDEKLKKKEDEKIKKKGDEKLQKKAEPEKMQKAPQAIFAKPIQLKEEEKLQKKEELKKKGDEKLQKKAEPEKPQKTSDLKVLKSAESMQSKPAAVQTNAIQLKDEEKLQKAEPEKQKPKEFEGAGKVQKKAEAEKVQKAESNSIQPLVQASIGTTVAPSAVQLKEEEKLQKAADEKVQKAGDAKVQAAGDEKIMKMSAGSESDQLSPEFEARLQGTLSGGTAMPKDVRSFMESRFDADFGQVRFHLDTTAVQMCNEIGARAFAYKNHVYFNRGQYSPDTDSGRFLIAHELTHVIQQGYATQKGGVENAPARVTPKADEKLRASQQNISSSSPRIQRLGWDTVNNAVRRVVPIWTLLTVIMGHNPILGQNVPRGPIQWFQGLLDLIPIVGPSIFDKLRDSGLLARAEAWLNSAMTQLPSMGEIRATWDRCWSDMGILHGIDGNIEIFIRHFNPIFTRIRNFVTRVLAEVVRILRETLLRPLNNVIKDVPGWDLITTLIGSNPLTGENKPRTAMNVLRGVVAFIPGGQEKLDQLVQSGAIQKAYAWFIEETTARNLTWARISATFTRAWDSLSANDILHPIDTFNRLRGMVSPLLSDLAGFALAALIKLLEFIYEAVMGAGGARVLAIIKRTQATFLTIIRNPVGFLGNLLRAVGMGIANFGTNILRHLQTGVITWLTGTLARGGVEIPTVWDLAGILRLIMSILGLTWPRIREIAVRVFGPTVVTVLETTAGLVMDIKEKGFVQTMRDKISEIFGNVREMILGRIKSFIQTRIVMAGIQWLASMLSPVGAVIQAIIKTYETVMFFIQKINEIMEFVNTILNAVENIANGALGPAAAYVENALARTIPLILDFLARLLGLGDVGGMIRGLIQQIQTFIAQKIEQAMIGIRTMVQRLIASGRNAAGRVISWWSGRKQFTSKDNHSHTISFRGTGAAAQLIVASEESALNVLVNKIETGLNKPENAQKKQELGGKLNRLKELSGVITPIELRLKNNTSTNAQQDSDQLSRLMSNDEPNGLSKVLEDLIPFADMPDIPNAVLPPYVNGVKANSFESTFISQKTPRGEEADAHTGNMQGWSDLTNFVDPDAKKSIRQRDNYVKMHLFHARWGKATDSNLTPAKSGYNTAFYNQVENFAVTDINNNAKVIWFKAEISYHDVNDGPVATIDYSKYPKTFKGSYGYMIKNGSSWTKGAAVRSYPTTIPVPQFGRSTNKVFDFNTEAEKMLAAIDIGRPENHPFRKLPINFTRLIYNERNKRIRFGGSQVRTNIPYTSYAQFKTRLIDANNRADKKVSNFVEWVNFVDIAHQNNRILPR